MNEEEKARIARMQKAADEHPDFENYCKEQEKESERYLVVETFASIVSGVDYKVMMWNKKKPSPEEAVSAFNGYRNPEKLDEWVGKKTARIYEGDSGKVTLDKYLERLKAKKIGGISAEGNSSFGSAFFELYEYRAQD